MQGILDALNAVGNDSIQDLYNFMELIFEAKDTGLNTEEREFYEDTIKKVGFAIFTYAVNKERADAKSSTIEGSIQIE